MPTHVPTRVDAATVRHWTQQPGTAVVLDVRTPAEFETAHLTGSYCVPLDLLSEHTAEFAAHLDRPVVLICQSGVRAEQAAQRLAGVGLANLHVLDGGLPALTAAGAPITRGRARWAMDRQVRLVAGSLVLTGALTSLLVPAAIALPIAVGAGLTFSALTNSCAMGAVLGRLPYNRGPAAPTKRDVVAQLGPATSAA
jgi:rhodanese-related sulfurtransferase